MSILDKNLEVMEFSNLESLYKVVSNLYINRFELENVMKLLNKDLFIKKANVLIKDECIKCTHLISKEDEENLNEVKELYNFFNNFNFLFGEDYSKKLFKKIGFIESHIDETIKSLDDLNKFKDNVFIENISSWDNKDYLQSVQAHKDVNEKSIILEEDFFKPLIGQFINNLSKDKKAEFLLKIDLIKKSGWAKYIFCHGENDENKDIRKLNEIYKEYEKTKPKILNFDLQKEFKTSFERFFETVEVGITVNEKGLNIANIQNKSNGLYNLATSGMPDGSIMGCPHNDHGDILYVGWATANTKKYAQNLQWFRHLEGIDFSIKMKRKDFEKFKDVDGSIVSLAINHDEETIGFINKDLTLKEKNAFQILGETTEICKGISSQNGRFKSLVNKISSISLIGSKTEMILSGKDEENIKDILFNVIKDVNKVLKDSINEKLLTDQNKTKREIYLTDFCNAISYLSELNKNNQEFKSFLKNEISPTFIGIAKIFPEMSNHLTRTLSFSMMNCEGISFDALNEIESNANIGYDKDYLQRSFHHFEEKAIGLSEKNKDIEDFINDTFNEIKKPLYELIYKNADFHKLKNSPKENALWHMLRNENLPNKQVSDYERSLRDATNKFKNKKTANKCIEFFKEIQKGFPHLTFLSFSEEIEESKKERISRFKNTKEVYEKHFGKIEETYSFNKEKIKNLENIEKLTENALKDLEILELKAQKTLQKEIKNYIEECIKFKGINKNVILEEIENFNFKSGIKEIIKKAVLENELNNKNSLK